MRLWLITVLLSAGYASSVFAQTPPAPTPPPAAAPGTPDEQVLEQARQRLRETLQSTPPAAPGTTAPTPTPAVAQAPLAAVAAPGGVAPGTAALPAPDPANPALAAELPAAMRVLDDKQKLSSGDRVSFRVQEDRDDPKPLIVTDSGEVEIPYIGRHKAGEKTCLQVAKEVKVLLEKDYYHRATVLISVDALSRTRGKVYLYGQVRAPGAIEIPADEILTVSKVILRVGGFADFANKRKVTVTRKGGDGRSNLVFEIDLVDILERGKTDKDMQVLPDDMIYVPQRLVNF